MNNINITNNILIVEDEWINADFLSDLVLSFGHNVIGIAKSAKDALEILSSNPCDLIFMDINIKGPIDGIQLARQLNITKKIPIIFITAFGDSETINEASETNIYGFVVKPFNSSHIEAVLSVAIARMTKEQKEIKIIAPVDKSQLDLGNGYKYNFELKTLYFENKPISFSQNESKLLFLLCSSYGDIIPLTIIRSDIWGEKDVKDSTIRDTILRVRKKIPILSLENISATGYSLRKEKS